MGNIQLVNRAAPIIKGLGDAKVVIVDTETSSLRPHRDGRILAGIGVKPLGGPAFYMSVRHKNGDFKQASMAQLRLLGKALRGRKLVYHNPKFDMAVLKNDGVDLVGEETEDTVVLVRLVSEEEPSYELKRLAKKYALKLRPEDPDSVGASEKALKKTMRDNEWTTYDQIPAEMIQDYVADDLEYTEWFYVRCTAVIASRDKRNLASRDGKKTTLLAEVLALEKRLTPWLFRMEERGVALNRTHVRRELVKAKALTKDLEKRCYVESGEKFNINSAPAIRKLFQGMGIRSKVKTKKGADSYNKDAMMLIKHPLAAAITSFRGAKNILDYYAKFKELMDADGVLHCSFHQAGARTGRFSCREPNLQNIPREGLKVEDLLADQEKSPWASGDGSSEHGKPSILTREEFEGYGAVRAAFVPRPGHFFLMADWRQVELMVLADYANDPTMIEAFRLGLDIHALAATAAYGPLPADAADSFRDWWRLMGKGINFGLVYGMGVALLAVKIGKSKEEARAFMDAYFARFSSVRRFLDDTQARCHAKGWVKNKWGRRRYLHQEIVYRAPNFLVQGSSADLMKERLVAVCEALVAEVLAATPLLTIHDELINEIPYDEAYKAIPIIVDQLETCDRLRVPLKVDLKWSPKSWAAKEKLDCDDCNGRGTALDVPVTALITALSKGDTATLQAAKARPCTGCEGRGWDLNKLRIPRTRKRVTA